MPISTLKLTTVLALGLGALTAVSGGATAAPKLQTLYKFCTQDNCADGGFPVKGWAPARHS